MITSTLHSGLFLIVAKRIICLIFCLDVFIMRLSAQDFSPRLDFDDPSQVHILETVRGDRFIGRVQKIEHNILVFLFGEKNQLTFKFSEIKSVYPFEDEEQKVVFTPTYLSVFPTGYNLPKGVWEYQNNSILWNTLYYGITDQFSAGGGFVIPAFFTLRIKFMVPITDRFGLGVQNQNFIGLSGEGGLSALTVSGTLGQPENFFNMGTGLLLPWDNEDEIYPVFSMGYSRQFGGRGGIHMIFNMIRTENGFSALPTGAFNYFGKNNRISLGVTLGTVDDFLGILAVPVLSFNQRF